MQCNFLLYPDFAIISRFCYELRFDFQLYVDGVPRGGLLSPECQAVSACGLRGGKSYEIAVVVFPTRKDEFEPSMSNVLVSTFNK